jgi:hypothetical protein
VKKGWGQVLLGVLRLILEKLTENEKKLKKILRVEENCC